MENVLKVLTNKKKKNIFDLTKDARGRDMQEITTYTARAIQTEAAISADLAREFVEYIDRGEATTRGYMTNLRRFVGFLLERGITAPRREDILSYRQTLIEAGCKPGTVAAYLRTVKQFFGWTAATGRYPNIAANIHAPKVDNRAHKRDCFTPAEVLAIEENIQSAAAARGEALALSRKDVAGKIQRNTEQGKRLYAMYLLAVNAGLRTIEISRANVKDLETKSGQTWLYVWGKGHSEADTRKALAPEVAAAIRDYLESRKDRITGNAPLFVSTGNRSAGKRIAVTTISTMLKGAMKAAGFNSERLVPHSLRHSAGTAVQELTGDIYATQKYMRHANPATTEIYLHNDMERKEAEIASRLYAYYHGQTANTGASLSKLLGKLTANQLDQLTAMAAAMTA